MRKGKGSRVLALVMVLALLFGLVVTPTSTYAGTEEETTETVIDSSGSDAGEEETTEDSGTVTESTTVATVGNTSYATLAEAVSAASNGETITLTSDVSESTVTLDKSVTLDLGNYTLATTYIKVASEEVEATVQNGTISGKNGVYLTAGKVTLNNCTVSLTDAIYCYGGELYLGSTTVTTSSTNRAINNYDSSVVTIDEESTVNAESGTGVVIWGDGSGETAKTPTLNVYGKINAIVCISGNGTDYSGTIINIGTGAVLTASTLGMYLPQPCTVNITDATVTGTYGAIGIRSGTLNITGSCMISGTGSYDADLESMSGGINTDGSAIIIDSYTGYAGNVTISISANENGSPTISSTNAVAIREISNSESTNVVSINISAGTITGEVSAISVTSAAKNTVSITGGTYSSDVSAYYNTEKYTTVSDSDGNVTVVAVTALEDEESVAVASLKVGETTTYYTTLAAAIAAATKGSTVTLLKDAEGSGIVIGSSTQCNFTIDFNNHTYTVNSDPLAGSSSTKTQCFQLLKDAGSITMKNGTIVADHSNAKMMIQNYCNLTLDGMTLDATKGTNNISYVLSNNNGNTTITGTTSITAKSNGVAFDVYYWPSGSYGEVSVTIDSADVTIDGTIEYGSDGTAAGKSGVADYASLTIEAGSISGSISTYNLGSSNEASITVASSLSVSITGSTTSFVALVGSNNYASLSDAFAAVASSSGSTVTLLADVTLTESLVVDLGSEASATFELNGHTVTFAYDSSGQFNGETLSDGTWGFKLASGTLTIQDTSSDGTGSIKTSDENSYVDPVGVAAGATLYITSGTYYTNSIYEAVVFATGSGTVVNISGGTFTNAAMSYKYNSEYTSGLILNIGNGSGAKFNVTGGTFYGRNPAEGDDNDTTTGATFVTENYAAAELIYGTDGAYTIVSGVVAVYDADGKYVSAYDSLSNAYTAVKNYSDGTICLLSDISSDKIKITSGTSVSFTLDLNGYTFDSGTNVAVLVQSDDASVTITDSSDDKNGKITSTNTTAAVYATAGSITVNGGTIDTSGTTTYVIRCGGGSIKVNDGTVNGAYIFRVDGGSVVVNGGTFTASGSIVYDVADDASLVINDGWFNSDSAFRTSGDAITVYAGYFTVSDANLSRLKNYISTGYTVMKETVDETEWYTVGKANFTVEYEDESGEIVIRSSHTTLSAAFSAAQNGDIIVMNADSESGIKLNDSSKSLTLDLNGYKITEDDADSYVIGVVSGSLTIIDSSEDGKGTITGSISESSSSSITGIVRNMGGTLVIESGIISINSGNAVNAYSGTTTIAGGYINGSVTTNSTLTITGGYFTEDPSDYTGNYEVAENETADYQYYVADVIVGKSIALEGVTTILIYVAEDGLTSATIGSTTYTDFSELDIETVGDISCYKFTQGVISYAMADDYDVILEVTAADGTSYTVTTTASVRDYADALFNSEKLDDTQKAILTALLNYGAKAQIYFNHNADDLANKNCADTSTSISAVITSDLSNYTNKLLNSSYSSISLKSYGLECNDNFVLTMKFSKSVENLTVTVRGTNSATYSYSTSGYYVLVELDATQLADTLTVTLTDSGNTGTYSFTTSALSYARTVIKNNTDTNKTALLQAVYLYYMSFSTTTSTETTEG